VKKIRCVCKAVLAFLAVAMFPLFLMGCGKSDEQGSGEQPSKEQPTEQHPLVEQPTEETRIEAPEIKDRSSIGDESDKLVIDDIDKLIKHIEGYGIFSRSAQVQPSIQEALYESEEYQKGVELHGLAADQKHGEPKESDRNYRLAATHFLKAATQHMEADISACTFRAGTILMSMNQPDHERTYLLLKLTLVINPKGKRVASSNQLINEIREKNLLSQEEMQALDKRVDKIQSVVR